MSRGYANAAEILPADLLAAVQRHFPGGRLYVPRPRTFYDDRRELVLKLKTRGIGNVEIAGLAGISDRRVRQIVAEKLDEAQRESDFDRDRVVRS